MTKKSRLDLHLLTKGLVKSRQEAQKLIRAGKVKTVNGQILDKPGQEVLKDLELEVTQPLKYVSRGGEKLAEAFNQFPLVIKNRVCLDAGISTGGFTDCLLQLVQQRFMELMLVMAKLHGALEMIQELFF